MSTWHAKVGTDCFTAQEVLRDLFSAEIRLKSVPDPVETAEDAPAQAQVHNIMQGDQNSSFARYRARS